MENRFTDKTVVITGAAGGIGAASSKLFAAEGARLVFAGRNEEKLVSMAEELGLTDENCLVCRCDISSESDVENLMAQTVDRFGRLDVMFNNAGVMGDVSNTHEYDTYTFRSVMDINVTGTFLGMKHALKQMMKQGFGVVINTCSTAGFRGNPFTIGYAASKHAINGMTRAAATEYAPFGIRVCMVAPAPVDTPMFATFENDMVDFGMGDHDTVHKMLTGLPLGRCARPEEVAKAVLFLASEDASFTTGTPVFVDGGFLA